MHGSDGETTNTPWAVYFEYLGEARKQRVFRIGPEPSTKGDAL